MKKISTSLTDNQIQLIQRSGLSTYAFLQIAVDEKLKNDSEKNSLLEFQKKLLEEQQQYLLLIVKEILQSKNKMEELHLTQQEFYKNSRVEIVKMLNKLAEALELKRG